MSVPRRRLPRSTPPPPALADWADALTPDELPRVRKRMERAATFDLLSTVACFLGGVWWDTRLLPTALVPAGLLVANLRHVTALDWRQRRDDRDLE